MQIVKIITYVPAAYSEKVRLAIGNAGGGVIGNYSHCAFVSTGNGYFMPLKGSNPFVGNESKIEEVIELKIEFVCDYNLVSNVIAAIKFAHPYEEVVIEIFNMINHEFNLNTKSNLAK